MAETTDNSSPRFLASAKRGKPPRRVEMTHPPFGLWLGCVLCVAFSSPLQGQEGNRADSPKGSVSAVHDGSGGEANGSPRPLPMADLPEPPAEVRELLESAPVQFEVGPEDDDRQIDKRRLMAAETRFEIEFSYRTKLRWQRVRDRLFVRVRDVDVQWIPRHRVWFRKQPPRDTFWSQPLVRHELDHVRISSDERLRRLFVRRAQSLGPLEAVLERGSTPAAQADRLAKQALTELFHEVTDLVRIRYRELDRLTDHGLRPLDEESELASLLRSSREP